MKSLDEEVDRKKPQLTIRETDIKVVISECGLSRPEAIELIQHANGDLKNALHLYLHA
jgi:NACalpha-BTF3-like transcription factor